MPGLMSSRATTNKALRAVSAMWAEEHEGHGNEKGPTGVLGYKGLQKKQRHCRVYKILGCKDNQPLMD